VPVECVCAERRFILRLHKLHEKRGVEVCPAGQAKHAYQDRQSMPSRTDRACPAGQTQHDQQTKEKHGQQEAHLEPGSDVKMLLHVCAQHLIDNHRPEESRVRKQILQDRHKRLSLIVHAMQHPGC